MKYLVLGSEGQIGAELCDYLRNQQHEVVEFDIVNEDAQDLRIYENAALDRCVEECDFVFFLAFDVGGSRYLKKYQHTYEFLHNNVMLMANTFDTIKKHSKPFIFASSQMSNMSYSPYGVAKAIGERYTDSLGGLVVKFWNVYGPEKDLEKSHVITDFILKARDTRKIDMLTDGTEVRQFLHAEDCSRCLEILSQRYSEIPRDSELHVTNFEWSSILDIAAIIAEHFEGTEVVPAKAKDSVQLDARNEADPLILEYWQPTIDIKTGIKMIIDDMGGHNEA